MTYALKNSWGQWRAYYVGSNGEWTVACDARGVPLDCFTETLALSVARYRRRRLKKWS